MLDIVCFDWDKEANDVYPATNFTGIINNLFYFFL